MKKLEGFEGKFVISSKMIFFIVYRERYGFTQPQCLF